MSNGHDSCIVEWDDLSGWVTGLGDTQRSRLKDALCEADAASRQAESAERWRSFVDTVRAVVAREAPDDAAVAVVFASTEWNEGFFVGSSGYVLFADGSTDDIDFGDDGVDDIFREEIGVVGRKFGLSVNLRTGAVDTDDDINDLYDTHGYPFPGRR